MKFFLVVALLFVFALLTGNAFGLEPDHRLPRPGATVNSEWVCIAPGFIERLMRANTRTKELLLNRYMEKKFCEKESRDMKLVQYINRFVDPVGDAIWIYEGIIDNKLRYSYFPITKDKEER